MAIITVTDREQRLEDHFRAGEFACKHCGAMKVDTALVDGLESMRALAGVPITITSGYRCPNHPESLRNPDSQHVLGKAADIRVANMPVLLMYRLAEQVLTFEQGGIGIYPGEGFIHVDTGPKRRWARVKGRYVTLREGFAACK